MKYVAIIAAMILMSGCAPKYDVVCGTDGSLVRLGNFQDATRIELRNQTCTTNVDGSYTVKFKNK